MRIAGRIAALAIAVSLVASVAMLAEVYYAGVLGAETSRWMRMATPSIVIMPAAWWLVRDSQRALWVDLALVIGLASGVGVLLYPHAVALVSLASSGRIPVPGIGTIAQGALSTLGYALPGAVVGGLVGRALDARTTR